MSRSKSRPPHAPRFTHKACTPRLLKLTLVMGMCGIWRCIEKKPLLSPRKNRAGRSSLVAQGSRETFGPRIQTKKPSAHPPVRLRGKRDQNSLSLAGRRPTRHSDARLSLPLPPTDLGALRLLPYSRPLARGPGCKCQRFTSTARPAGLAVANWFSIRDRVECRTQTLTAQLQSADAADALRLNSHGQGFGLEVGGRENPRKMQRWQPRRDCNSLGGSLLQLCLGMHLRSAQEPRGFWPLQDWPRGLHLGVSLPAPPRF